MTIDDPLCDLLLDETERVTLSALRAVDHLVARSRRASARLALRAAADALAVLDVSDGHARRAREAPSLDARRAEAAAALRVALQAGDAVATFQSTHVTRSPEAKLAWRGARVVEVSVSL